MILTIFDCALVLFHKTIFTMFQLKTKRGHEHNSCWFILFMLKAVRLQPCSFGRLG
uniref:Uncharacterized protein n=1 Tax=Arundo donax TaxID=35708 RepID=A0A0A8Z871_ARUDO